VRIIRGLAAAAVAACAAVGLAGPSEADNPPPHPEVLQGVYTYMEGGAPLGTCVPTVGDLREPLYIPVGCHLHVTPSEKVTGGDAVMTGGLWTLNTPKREGIQCADGSWEQTNEVLKFNPITLTGTRSIIHNEVCGLQPAIRNIPFTLAYKEPLPIPVDRYPLICEPGGLRRCF
jgi:hypothetical protein